jgi:predicted nuclease with TOPRIM domain
MLPNDLALDLARAGRSGIVSTALVDSPRGTDTLLLELKKDIADTKARYYRQVEDTEAAYSENRRLKSELIELRTQLKELETKYDTCIRSVGDYFTVKHTY